jgi:hypothetical protein
VKLTTRLHLVSWSRMGGAIRPLSHYAFVAWCSVKGQGQLYLTLPYFILLCLIRKVCVIMACLLTTTTTTTNNNNNNNNLLCSLWNIGSQQLSVAEVSIAFEFFYRDRVASPMLQPPTWRTRSPYLYPLETGWPSYTPRHWVPILVAFYDMHGLQWDYSFPRSPHGELACLVNSKGEGVPVLFLTEHHAMKAN